MMNKAPLSAIVLGCTALSTSLSAFVVTYDFTGGSAAANVAGSDAAGVDAENFVVSNPDTTQNISSFTNMAFIRSQSTASTELAALDGRYFSFTISAANASERLDLSSLTIDIGGSSDNGNFTAFFTMQSSVGGFGSSNPALTLTPNSKSVLSGNGNQLTTSNVTISGSAFDSVDTVEFRIYAYDDKTDNAIIDRFDNVVVSGDVIVVPEPSTYAALAGALVLALTLYRRKRS